MKNKKNIAMRCNKEQFEAIKPKLEKVGEIGSLNGAFTKYKYLTNNYTLESKLVFDLIGNCSVWSKEHGGNVHEQWNEKVFLEACGIETTPTLDEVKEYFKDADLIISLGGCKFNNIDSYWNESHFRTHVSFKSCYICSGTFEVWNSKQGYAKIITKKSPEYTITREQVLELAQTNVVVKEKMCFLFPKAFDEEKVDFEVGKWYKCKKMGNIVNLKYLDKPGNYGFTYSSNLWDKDLTFNTKYDWEISTPQEVEQALKGEAGRRGYGANVYVKDLGNTQDGRFSYNPELNHLYCGSCAVFCSGIWATIIPTKTLKEAEEELKCKIVN